MEVVLEQGVVIAAALELHLSTLHVGGENGPALVLDRVLYTHALNAHCEVCLAVGGVLVVGEVAANVHSPIIVVQSGLR